MAFAAAFPSLFYVAYLTNLEDNVFCMKTPPLLSAWSAIWYHVFFSQSLILNFDSEVLYKSLKLWVTVIEDGTDSSIIE